jgi:adenine-specific DNA-methyltransferase
MVVGGDQLICDCFNHRARRGEEEVGDGRRKEAEITRTAPSDAPTSGDVRHGFIYARVPHVTLKFTANNAEIDAIWERIQPEVEAAHARLKAALANHPEPFPILAGSRAGQTIDFQAVGETVTPSSGETAPRDALLEWEIPREAPSGCWISPVSSGLSDILRLRDRWAMTKAASL